MFLDDALNQLNQHQLTRQHYEFGHLLPVLSDTLLLAGRGHKALLRELKEHCLMKGEDFNYFYAKLVSDFAEFVQVLPVSFESPLSSLLNRSLARAILALRHERENNQGTRDVLIEYAIFTAALLQDVSKIMSHYRIVATEKTGEFISLWQPLAGSLLELGAYYKIYPLDAIHQRLEHDTVVLLARQLLSGYSGDPRAFNWLSEDPNIFADWLAALHGGRLQGGRITHTLSLIKQDELLALLNHLQPAAADLIKAMNTHNADALAKWLIDGIRDESIRLSGLDSDLYAEKGELYLREKALERFQRESDIKLDKGELSRQLEKLLGNDQKIKQKHAANKHMGFMGKQHSVTSGFKMPANLVAGIMLSGGSSLSAISAEVFHAQPNSRLGVSAAATKNFSAK